MPIPDASPPTVEARQCAGERLYERLMRGVGENPALAFACAGLLPTEEQRDRVLAGAFATALTKQPELARRYLPLAIGKPWMTDAGFFPVLRLAQSIAADSPGDARTLLVEAARKFPSLALREYAGYSSFPFGAEVFEQAALAAPDEAAGIASGASLTAAGVLNALRSGQSAELPILARLAADAQFPQAVRQRAAAFVTRIADGRMPYARAVEAAAGPAYFPALADCRVSASGREAIVLDRILESYAEVLFRGMDNAAAPPPELSRLSARDLYLLLGYGRTEEDDSLFDTIFDRLLLPKLRATPVQKVVEEARGINVRHFLATAAAHRRLEKFHSTLEGAFDEIDRAERPIEEMIAAAEILAAIRSSPELGRVQDALLINYDRAGRNRALYGLLVASSARVSTSGNTRLEQVAAEYRRHFREPRALDTARLFDASNRCVQQYLFYDDDDAAESFESFRGAFAKDHAWTWTDSGWYIQASAQGGNGRRIEIFANVPHSVQPEGSGDRRHALAKLLAERSLTPSILVHRGHTWYVPESLEYLTASLRLVYLGSCRGLENTYAVVTRANQAQLIATRGIGTTSINDALLKAIDDELLSGNTRLDWTAFWKAQEAKMGGSLFRDYLPPPDNIAAILLAAYYDYVAAGGSLAYGG